MFASRFSALLINAAGAIGIGLIIYGMAISIAGSNILV